ncbi:MAG: trigger factor [Firmicutes bacterium]|nr:trigger factor [Bacillota bacterium]
MKATLISKENNVAKFTMEFTAEELEAAIVKVYQREKGKFSIDGFRKGKAPRSIIEKRYGEGIFLEDAIGDLFQASYPYAIDEVQADVIGYPETEPLGEIKKGEGFAITVSVECYPEFTVENYKGIEIEEVSSEVTDEDVDKAIQTMAEGNARMVDVERPAQNGDTVVIDYAGFVGEDQFEGGTAERQPLELGSGSFIPGFEDQLVGATKGEQRDVNVTFPEVYHSEDLAGKEAVFKCTVHEIKEKQIPAVDDEFVKDISEFDTLEELKASKKEELQKAAVANAENSMKNSVIEALYNASDLEVPEVLIQQEVDAMMSEFEQQLQMQGMDLENYLKLAGIEASALRGQLKDDAEKRCKTRMLVSQVAIQEDIQATDDEVQEELKRMAQQYGLDVEKLTEMIGAENLNMLKGDIRVRKAVDLMYDAAVRK